MSLTSPALERRFLTSETRLIKDEYKKRNRKYCFQALSLTTFFLFFFESTSGIVFPSLVAEKKMDLKLGRKLLEGCQSLALVLDCSSVPIWPADFWMEPYFILSVNASELMGIFLSLLQKNHFCTFSACAVPCKAHVQQRGVPASGGALLMEAQHMGDPAGMRRVWLAESLP